MGAVNDKIEQYKHERNEAIRKGGQAYADFLKKWNVQMANHPEVRERARLKAITACTDIPMEERSAAKAELRRRGSESWDDGGVP